MPDNKDDPRFEAILQGHRELKLLLAEIDRALAEQTAAVEEVSEKLGRLGDLLVRHFTMEEDEGYFSEALLRAPQLVAKANQLLAQHPKMRCKATALISDLSLGPQEDWWTKTRRLFLEFRDELTQHERQEDRLIQEAYVRDVGAND